VERARGAVTDRPWGRTLALLGLRGATGQLTLRAGAGPAHAVVFDEGAVVAASSPLASDSAVRLALTSGLIGAGAVQDLARRQAATPGGDEIELIAEHARLSPEQALRLRRRVVAQRAARTFSVDRGDFVLVDEIELPVVAGSALDVRAVIYLGARTALSEIRLATELHQLGQWFRIRADAVDDLPQFGFTDAEAPLLTQLQAGATLGECEQGHDAIDQRTIRATLYALACCSACDVEGNGPRRSGTTPPRNARTSAPPATRAGTASSPPATRAGTASSPPDTAPGSSPGIARPPGSSPGIARPPGSSPGIARPPGSSPGIVAPPGSSPGIALRPAAGRPPRSASAPPATVGGRRSATPLAPRVVDPKAVAEVERLIAERLALLDADADHFAILGLAQDAAPDVLRATFFALARQLHPDRLASLGIADPDRHAQRLFARLNTAFAILGDPVRRHDYVRVLSRGGEAVVRAEQARAEELAAQILAAEDAFHHGEMALRRDHLPEAIAAFSHAIELNPDEPDFHALLAWARFCASPDKPTAAAETRTVLGRAAAAAPKSVTAPFFLGRVERMLGNDREALCHFQDVLKRSPHHGDATSEVRILEARLASAAEPAGKAGLFGRKKG
jgi:hypothetical protein